MDDGVRKTLYIPLYGKAFVSRKGLFLDDPNAEAMWESNGIPLRGKARSKWLAYYMGIRAAVFDAWTETVLKHRPDATVLHLGCGLDARVRRIKETARFWYDIDFPDVIAERKRWFSETDTYRMLGADVRDGVWLSAVQGEEAIVVMEGIAMYLKEEECATLMERLGARFQKVTLLVDCYTPLGAKLSKARNPVREVGVQAVYGVSSAQEMEHGGLVFQKAHEMTPRHYVKQLRGVERAVFSKLYAGKLSGRLYRLYEYAKQNEGEIR